MGHNHNDMDDARKRAKLSRKQIETGGRFKPPEGKSEIRILETPPDRERDSPALYMEYFVHRNVGPNKRFCMCGNKPGQTKHKRCWLCKKKKKYETSKQQELAVQVAVKDQDLDELVGPLVWQMGVGKSADAMGYKIKGVISSDRRNYTDHKRGYNLHFKRTGLGLKTKWSDIDHDDEPSRVPKGILKQLKPFVDTGIPQYDEQWQKDCYYGRDENSKGEDDNMAGKKKSKKQEVDESSSDASSSDASSSDASSSSSDASGSDASGSNSDASSSSSDASSSDVKTKKGKKGKKGKKDSSDSDASASDSSGSDASGSDASGSDSDASGSDSDASGSDSDASGSDASGSDASSSSSDASSSDEDEKPKRGKGKRKPRSDKGKARKPKKGKKGKK